MQKSKPTSTWVPIVSIGLALMVLGGAVEQGTLRLRRAVRERMINRDGEILHAVAQARQFSDTATNLTRRLQAPVEQLALALDISQIKDGVMGVRLFDAGGKFVTAFPPNVKEASLDPTVFAAMKALRPASRFDKAAKLSDEMLTWDGADGEEAKRVPLIEVNIPIHARGDAGLLGCAQLIMDARDLEADCARLDRSLAWEAMAVFAPGAIILTGGLGWAYRRLQRTNHLLEERTAGLLRANHELTLAAKTGALGAVTAHLIHGLSNPLANLEDFVTARGSLSRGDEEWQDAIAATDRMRRLVHEVVRVLGEETGGDHYEMSLEECGKVLADKAQPVAREFGVVCEIVVVSRRRLANHPANIVLLILDNLINNSLQVMALGRKARVTIRDSEEGVVCEVADEGPGFPEELSRMPFGPCRSTKGGAGLGLAISQQLAVHLGGRLELRETGAAGTLIWLRLPRAVFEESAGTAGLAGRSHSMVEES